MRIWSNDHLPRYVRMFKNDGECVINLVGAGNNPELREFYGMKRKEVAKAIATLSKETVATVKLTPSGKGLRWEQPDIDVSIQGLLLGVFGSNVWMKEIASKGGRAKSPQKAVAAKANGKKGGRPRKS